MHSQRRCIMMNRLANPSSNQRHRSTGCLNVRPVCIKHDDNLNRTLIMLGFLLSLILFWMMGGQVYAAGYSPDSADNERPRLELAFIDPGVDGYQHFVDSFAKRTSDEIDARVIVLHSDRDGLQQISESLQHYRGVDAIHIVSRGTKGRIRIARSDIDLTMIQARVITEEIQAWQASLNQGADILVYGCDIANGPAGDQLLQRLSELTGSDVAGSEGKTGTARHGGNWSLGRAIGNIETLPLVAKDYEGSLGIPDTGSSMLLFANKGKMER